MSDFPLTPKKEKWAKSREDVALEGIPLNYNAGDQTQYVKNLTALVKQMSSQIIREVTKFFKTDELEEFYDQQEKAAALDESVSEKAKKLTDKLTAKFQALFDKKAKVFASDMVKNSQKTSASNLKTSFKKLSGGLSLNTKSMPRDLKQIASVSIDENVTLIKSISSKYLTNVSSAILRSITTASGLKYLIPQLRKFEGISYRHAKNVALDQTRKVYNSMNKGKMEQNGINKFRWKHSGGGQHPRPDHIAMSGDIYSFDNLPIIDKKTGERGIPGQAINCKCVMIPIVEFDNGEQDAT